MKTRKILIPKRNIWISLSLIIIPIIFLVLLRIFNFLDFETYGKIVTNLIASTILLGMLLLFITQWTKDDGDEMYLQFRLISSLSSVFFGVGFLLVNSIWDLVTLSFTDFGIHNSFFLMFMILWWQLFVFGSQVYKLRKELTKND